MSIYGGEFPIVEIAECEGYVKEVRDLYREVQVLRLKLLQCSSDLKLMCEAEERVRWKLSGVRERIDLTELVQDIDFKLAESTEEANCEDLRQLRDRLSSARAALKFRVYLVCTEARNEVIRLSGLIAMCRRVDPDLADRVYQLFKEMYSKYLVG